MNRGLVGNRVGDRVVEVTVESGTLAYAQKDINQKGLRRGVGYPKTISRIPEGVSGAGRNCTELRATSLDGKHSEVMNWGRDGRVRT